jgi:hypothetical protein
VKTRPPRFFDNFLALLDYCKEATAKQREAKQLLESVRDGEARCFEEKRRAEEIATGNIRRFVESEGWHPDRLFGADSTITVRPSATQNDRIVKVVNSLGIEERRVIRNGE